MLKILKEVPSLDRAKRYRELERDAEWAAASVPPLYREHFKRTALKWKRLAEEAERGTGCSMRPHRSAKTDAAMEY